MFLFFMSTKTKRVISASSKESHRDTWALLAVLMHIGHAGTVELLNGKAG